MGYRTTGKQQRSTERSNSTGNGSGNKAKATAITEYTKAHTDNIVKMNKKYNE